MIVLGALRHQSFIVRKQLKWIVYGLGFGVVPFTGLYVIPFVAGAAPSTAAELTVLLQALIPLSFSYSISRYKLMDLEVIIKKAATLVFSYFVLALIYLGVSSQTKIFSENKLNALLLGVLALILGATMFTPLRIAHPVGHRPGLLPEELPIPENPADHLPGAEPGAQPRDAGPNGSSS